MNISDMFKPYSPEIKGDLETYLRTQDDGGADNMFLGPKYFFVLKDKGFLVPNISLVRVGFSPAPDICYFVNSDFLLESHGSGDYNMSAVDAKKGVYDPNKALKNKIWSVSGLNLKLLFNK